MSTAAKASAPQAPQDVPGNAGPTASQQAHFQQTVNGLAHHLVGLFILTNVPPEMASLVCSQIIRAVVLDLMQTNKPLAKILLEEFAVGLVELCQEIGVDLPGSQDGQPN